MKPRIYRDLPIAEPFVMCWRCDYRGTVAFGHTPQIAYRRCMEHRDRTGNYTPPRWREQSSHPTIPTP